MAAYDEIDARLGDLSTDELDMLTGAILAERVNRGQDHDTALAAVVRAAVSGDAGSKMFDEVE